MTHTAYIGIGSNLGNRLKNCLDAVGRISELKDTRVLTVSGWHENPALTENPKSPQPDYINGAIKIETVLSPERLLAELKCIEEAMGREARHDKWSPRTIDLDILLYNDKIIESGTLIIPHPEMCKRTFVLGPLCDIAPGLIHPVFNASVEKLLGRISL